MAGRRDGAEEPEWRHAHRDSDNTAALPETDTDRKLVLVVEDNPHDWEIYGKILWYNGFEVLCAADGAKALDLAEDHRPDLVLLDLGLPEMDGLELCRRFKHRATGPDVPVLVLSARSERKYGDPARRAGCVQYLEKPQSPVQVLHAVEQVIGTTAPGADGAPPEMERSRS